MTYRVRALALAALAAVVLPGCSSGPSYPHSWCGPLMTQLRTSETRSAENAGLAALQKSGAPVGELAADLTAYEHVLAAENGSGTASYSAVLNAPAALAKLGADLKQLNSECGQPATAYKSDIV
jgi:hypothetical protein